MKLGTYQTLYIKRFTPQGAYLVNNTDEIHSDAEGLNEILLPNKYVQRGASVSDEVTVFVMKDSNNRKVAVGDQVKLVLDTCAMLKVVEINDFGAFVDWGLDKNLFVPYAEQRQGIEIGDSYPVFLKYDPITDRLFGSMKIRKYLQEAPVEMEFQTVNFMPYAHHELGWQGIVNEQYHGMLYRNDCKIAIRLGMNLECHVKTVRADGKLDLQISATSPEKYDEAVEKLSQYFENNKFLYLTDKSSSEDIYTQFKMSKKTFKQAVGKLYKARKIKLFEDKIARIDE